VDEPFQRSEQADRPGVVGAKWWQEGLADVNPVARRSALKAIIGGTVGLGVFGLIIGNAFSSSKSDKDDEDYDTTTHAALEMQKEYGWNFGATAERLVFDGKSTSPFDKTALANLPKDLAPASASLYPFFVPTLLQSPVALRKTTPSGDPDTFTPLKDVLVPIFTPAMDIAYRRGQALAALFDSNHAGSATTVIVDLPGPEAVAFAAGASSAFDPVLLFDNWPHPKGVVASHLTLAACAYYQPLFAARNANANGDPLSAPADAGKPSRTTPTKRALLPMFVLDRARLAPYSDDSKQFDNRYTARVPSVAPLAKLGISRVLYVMPANTDVELDDLNDDFVYTVKQSGVVRAVAAETFTAAVVARGDGGVSDLAYYYGDGAATNEWFWKDYPYSSPYVPRGATPPTEPSSSRRAKDYVPTARLSPFSTGAMAGSLTPPRPPTFGLVPVVVAAATGVILGAKMSRSGSWTRSSSWGGG
jgi:hypothetical protein